MGESVKIAYLCDGLDECSDKFGCFRHMKTSADNCRHTFNPAHAVNGPVRKPEKYPERFFKLEVPNEEETWWEGEVIIP